MFGFRFLRRRSFLAAIFACSLIYFVTSIYRQSQGQSRSVSSEELVTRRVELSEFTWLFPPNANSTAKNNKPTETSCQNSVQGRDILVDDRGYICGRELLGANGCCINATQRYVCQSCQRNGCCSVYEHCVSCCVQPDKLALLRRIVVRTSGTFHNLLTSVSSLFEFCLAKCRTSSQSVLHENSYRNSIAKHCYSDRLPDIQPPG
jgi:hypothetical protein